MPNFEVVNQPAEQVALAALVEYVAANVPWVPEPGAAVPERAVIREMLLFHALQGTLRVEWQSAGEPIGLAIVWQDFSARVRAEARAGDQIFRWQRTERSGDCHYLDLVIATAPGVLTRLLTWFRKGFAPRPVFMHRRGKLRVFSWEKFTTIKFKEIYGFFKPA